MNPKITEEQMKIAEMVLLDCRERDCTHKPNHDEPLVYRIAHLLASHSAQAAHAAASACVKAVEAADCEENHNNGFEYTIDAILKAVQSAAQPYLKRD